MRNENYIAYFFTILAGISFGVVPVISVLLREQNISVLEQLFLRLFFGVFIAILFFCLFFIKNKNSDYKEVIFLSKKLHFGFFAQGFLLSSKISVYIAAIIIHTPIGEAALLIQVHPIITLLIGWIFLKEVMTKEKVIAVMIAIFGIIILAEPWTWNNGFSNWLGDSLALLNGIFFAFYIIIGRKHSSLRSEIHPTVSLSWVLFWAFLTGLIIILFFSLLPIGTEFNSFNFDKVTTTYIIFLGIMVAIIGYLIPYGLLILTAKSVESFKASILTLGEPISAIILGYALFSEPITINYIIGGLMVLISISIVLRPVNNELTLA